MTPAEFAALILPLSALYVEESVDERRDVALEAWPTMPLPWPRSDAGDKEFKRIRRN